ncbi:MAG: hypothetical protein RL538_885 [Candidatus Parcubacteria bacterium]
MGVSLRCMEQQLLYSEIEFARVKWYLVSSGRDGTIEDILNVTREGYVKAGQIQERLHQEGIVDLYEVREFDE